MRSTERLKNVAAEFNSNRSSPAEWANDWIVVFEVNISSWRPTIEYGQCVKVNGWWMDFISTHKRKRNESSDSAWAFVNVWHENVVLLNFGRNKCARRNNWWIPNAPFPTQEKEKRKWSYSDRTNSDECTRVEFFKNHFVFALMLSFDSTCVCRPDIAAHVVHVIWDSL